MRIILAALLASVSTAAIAAPWKQDVEAPPTMDPGYVLVQNKCPGDSGWPTPAQLAGKDVKIEWPKDRKCVSSTIKAMHTIAGTEANPVKDVWSVGGHFENIGLNFQNYGNGTIFIEGAIIDHKGNCQDAINAYYGRGDGGRFVVQQTHMTGVGYCSPGTHGDTIHIQGTGALSKEVKLENVWAHQVRQGIFVPPRPTGGYPGHGTNKLVLDHVFLQADPLFAQDGNAIATSIFWKDAGYPLPANGVWFGQKVYLKWWGGKPAGNSNWRNNITIPNASGSDANRCSIYDAASSGVRAGKWCAGDPPDGPPVSLDKIGRNYNRSYFTGSTPPDDPDPPDPPADTSVKNRILTKEGFAALDRVLAAEFLGQTRPNDVVVFAYREHAKGAAAGANDLCRSTGVTWGGDVAQDVMYITSALSAPADLDVIVGNAPAVRIALPANQAQAGQQSTVPIGDKVGLPKFVLWRDGAKVAEWNGRAEILASPAARNVSTYAGFKAVAGAPQQRPRAWFSAVSLDQPEGNTGSTAFVIRAHRETATDTMSARCTVQAGAATASDFAGGALPVVDFVLPPGALTQDGVILARGETDVEPDEDFVASCGSVLPAVYDVPATTTLHGIIRNDDASSTTPSLLVRTVAPTVIEGTSATPTPIGIEVVRGGPATDALSVDLCQIPSEMTGAAATASDFVGGFTKQIIEFAPGETGARYVEPKVIADANPEPDEWATYRLLYPSAGAVITTGTANVLIKDDDTPLPSSLRINAGAETAFTDSAGAVWAPDTGTGGSTSANAFDFSGTTDDTIYRTFRYGASRYDLEVAPGLYDIYGLFSEPDASNDNVDCDGADPEEPSDDIPGRRLMSATVAAAGGDTVVTSPIDPYCAAGFRAAYRERIGRVNAAQGDIRVDLRSAPGSQAVPLLNGIEALKITETEPARPAEWLNVGAPEDSRYTDAAQNTWRGMPPAMVTGCTSVVDPAKPPIENTEADELYWSRCQGLDINFTIPIAATQSATRAVNMLFAEPTAPEGARVVDVYVQGVLQLADLDVRAASGALQQALIKSVSPVTIGGDGMLRVRVVSKTAAPAIVNSISVTEPLVESSKTETIGWKNRKLIAKTALIKLASPTLRSPAGNPLVVRKVDTTNSSVYVCHGACPPTATRGVQPDTEAANNSTLLEIMAHAPGDPTTSVFPALGRFSRTTDSFKVTIAELLPNGSLGVETIITVNLDVHRVL